MFPTLVFGPNREILVSQIADKIEGGIFAPITAQNPVTVAARVGTANGLADAVLTCPTDGWLRLEENICSVAGTATDTGRLLCQIEDNSTFRRQLSNRPVPFAHAFGSRTNPFLMAEYAAPLLLQPQQGVSLHFINPDASGTALPSFCFNGTKVKLSALKYPKVVSALNIELLKNRQVTPYWFVCDGNIVDSVTGTLLDTPGVTVAQSATVENFYTNKNDITLVLAGAIFTAYPEAGAAGDTQEVFTVEIFDPRTQKPLQTQPVSSNCVAGTASFPCLFSTPIYVGPGQYLRTRLTSLITNKNTDIFLTFFGVAVYTGGKTGNHDWKGRYVEDPAPIPLRALVGAR